MKAITSPRSKSMDGSRSFGWPEALSPDLG
jgi:hypothetical protein